MRARRRARRKRRAAAARLRRRKPRRRRRPRHEREVRKASPTLALRGSRQAAHAGGQGQGPQGNRQGAQPHRGIDPGPRQDRRNCHRQEALSGTFRLSERSPAMLRSQDLGDCSPPVREGPRVRPNRETDGLPMPRRYWAIAAISFGTSLFVVDGAIANVALPTIGRELGVGNGPVTNVVTVYQLMLVMVLLPFSSFGDRVGHRTLYQIGQVLFLVASAVVLFISNFP